jgi:hypothetical protein
MWGASLEVLRVVEGAHPAPQALTAQSLAAKCGMRREDPP